MNMTLLPIPVAAERMGVSNKTVYRLFNRGMLRKVKIGRSTRVSEQELNEYIEKQFKDGGNDPW
jgi:excisionase family DNA binding protein